jgi:cholesterol transport system auxiliary component
VITPSNQKTTGARKAVCALAVALLTGCAASSPPTQIERYDFGPRLGVTGLPAFATALPNPIAVGDLVMPQWLDSPALVYRLAESPQRPQVYAYSRWVSPPGQLMTDRLRSRLAQLNVTAVGAEGARNPSSVLLWFEIEEFAHSVQSQTASEAVIVGRTYWQREGKPVHMRAFRIVRPAATVDAAGGAKALIEAADEYIEQSLLWLSGPVNQGVKP